MGKIEAASQIVQQTIWPLLGATIVAVLAFTGIGLSQDNTGEFTRSLFQVVMISMMLSWLTAITFTPLFCDLMLTGPKDKKKDHDDENKVKQTEEYDAFGGSFYKKYRKFLTTCINYRWITLSIMGGMLVAGYLGFGFVKNAFFPALDRPQFALDMILTQGTDINETSEIMKDVEKYLLKRKDVKSVSTSVGGGNMRFMLTYTAEDPNDAYGQFLITTYDSHNIDKIIADAERELPKLFPDAIFNGWKFMIGSGGGAKIGAQFIGNDANVLRELSQKAIAIMRADPQAKAVRTDWRQRVKIVRPIFSEAKARAAGISRSMFKDTLQRIYEGKQAGLYREGEDLIPIVARAPKSETLDVDGILDAQIWSPVAQKMIPLRQIISGLNTDFDNAIIARKNRKRTLEVQCDPAYGLTSELFDRIKPQIEAIDLPPGYELFWGAEREKQLRANKALGVNLPVSFIFMILIVIILFNSVKKAGVIILSVPFILVGVTFGLLITNSAFSFVALLGLLSLTGMMIKNGIVLVDQIALEIDEGKPRFTAIVESSMSRVRPVSMAAATTILGMIPLLWDVFFKDMAVTIMFGLGFATVLALVLVPVMYAAIFKVQNSEQ
jgi:multidrug efflux pump subunit AcrB